MWKSLCPLHRSVKSSLLHLQLPKTWTPERLLMNQYSPLDAMAFKWVVVFHIYMLNASSVVLLLVMYDLSPYHQVRWDAGRTHGKHWHIKGLFSKGPLGDVWHSHGSWFAFNLGRSRVFWCWLLSCFSVWFFLFFSFFPACLCQLEDNKEWKRWVFSEGVSQMRVFWKSLTHK